MSVPPSQIWTQEPGLGLAVAHPSMSVIAWDSHPGFSHTCSVYALGLLSLEK